MLPVVKSILSAGVVLAFGVLCFWNTNARAEPKRNASPKVKAAAAVRRVPATEPSPAASVDEEDFLEREQKLRTIRAQMLGKEVARMIDAAQRTARQDPDAAMGELKRTLTTVISSTDIDPDLREKLRVKLQANLEQVLMLKRKVDQDRILRIERMAAVQARELATEQLLQRDEQIEQLIDKVRSLITEGYMGNAEAFERAEEVARASFELAPYNGVTSAAIFDAEASGQLDKAQRLRYLRYDKFLAALYQVELAHVPFPDEPPILYPAPEVWKALTDVSGGERSASLAASLEPSRRESVAVSRSQRYHSVRMIAGLARMGDARRVYTARRSGDLLSEESRHRAAKVYRIRANPGVSGKGAGPSGEARPALRSWHLDRRSGRTSA